MARLTIIAFAAVVIFFCLSTTSALYFTMEPWQEKCFFEEIPYETLVNVKYKLGLLDALKMGTYIGFKDTSLAFNKSTVLVDYAAEGLGLKTMVKDPKGAVIMSKTCSKEGSLVFTSHMAGDHTICFSANDTSLEGSLRVHLDIKIGGYAVDYEVVKHKEKLTELQLKIRQMQDLTDQIIKEQEYQRLRENRFRLTSESTNDRVLWLAVMQTIILIAIGLYQVRHLKTYFIQKKLV